MLKIRIKNHRVNNHFQVSNIRINVLPKEIFALIGKSGSGKSTVAKIVVGLLQNENGSVVVNGVELNDHNERLIPQFVKAGYLPQNLHLNIHPLAISNGSASPFRMLKSFLHQ